MNTTINVQELSNEELLSVWKRVGLDVPENLVTETVRRGEAIVPELGAVLVDLSLWASPEAAGWAPIHAIFLLTAIGSPMAAPYVAEFLRRDLGESWTTEYGQHLVFSISSRGLEPIWEVITDESADEWGRVVAIEGVSWIALSDTPACPSIIERFRLAAAQLVSKPPDAVTARDVTLLTRLCIELGALHDEASRDLIRSAFAERRCDTRFADLEFVEYQYGVSFEESLWRAREDPLSHFDKAELNRLQQIVDESKQRDEMPDSFESGVRDIDSLNVDVPLVAVSKVGRNDPCPCGSGKKYKRCCLRGE